MMEVHSPLTGSRWVSLPFSDYSTPLYRDERSLSYLIDALVDLVQRSQAPRIEVRSSFPPHPVIASCSGYVKHTLQLYPDPKTIMGQFHRNHRQNIQTAEKRGICIERGEHIEHMRAFYQLQLETRHRHGVPAQPWRYFELLTHRIIEHGLGFILLARSEGQYVAGAVFLHWGETLTAKYAASRTDCLSLRPNELIFWTAMTWGGQNGFSIFDMGRTDCPNEGLREYKRRWGAQELALPYSVFGGKPYQLATGKSMELMQKVISRSPRWVCRFTGELLYRHFG
jgi:hypothetical protein